MLRKTLLRVGSTSARFSSQSTPKLVLFEKTGNGVGLITFNDPHRLNALTVPMGECFVETVKEVNSLVKTGEIRAVVLTGCGRAFSAGGDLEFLMERSRTSPKENEKIMLAFYSRFLLSLRSKLNTR